MVKRNFLLGRDHLISICCDIFWKPISSIMGNGCRSRAIISVIYEQCKQMVFWIFGFFPKTSCKLSCYILLRENPLIPGKGMGWLRIWLCTWKPGHAANLQKAKKLFFFFISPTASSNHNHRPHCKPRKEKARYLVWKVKMSHFAMVIRLSIFSPQDLCDSQGTLLAWQELITALIKVTFQTKAKRQTSVLYEAPEKLGGFTWSLNRILKNTVHFKRSMLGSFKWEARWAGP